jgi:Ca-activated chloride channel family protein
MMKDLVFQNIEFLWLLASIPVLAVVYLFRLRSSLKGVTFSSHTSFNGYRPGLKVRLRHLPFALRMLGLALLIIALARPQSRSSWSDIRTEGIDIVIAFDVSASMLARDFKPNRLDAAKDVAREFIEARPDDRIGLVVFSGESFTQCPLTTDHSVLLNLFSNVKSGMMQDGTAIGMGLSTAITRLKSSKAKSKVAILLTDGVNNSGSVSPLLAAELAKPFGIRVYAIGVGSRGKAYSPVAVYPNGEYVFDYVPVEIDEPVLKKVASSTGGRYFRATSKDALKEIYAEIDKLEKTIVEEKQYSKRSERFLPFLLAGITLIFADLFLKRSIFKSLTA